MVPELVTRLIAHYPRFVIDKAGGIGNCRIVEMEMHAWDEC